MVYGANVGNHSAPALDHSPYSALLGHHYSSTALQAADSAERGGVSSAA